MSNTAATEAEGWQARLQLQFERSGARTRLTRRSHQGPLLVQKAFYPESAVAGSEVCDVAEPCHVYLVHPPGGVVGADQLHLTVAVQAQAHALLTTPAAGKFYRCGGRMPARVCQSLQVEGVLEWLPQENIFYPGCAVQLHTIVRLGSVGHFIGWEIACLGLPASDQPFADGRLWQRFELWRDGRPLWLERLHIEPACLNAVWGLGAHVALGSWLACPASPAALEQARAVTERMNCTGMSVACTLIDGALSCRGYAARTDRLKQAFVDLWAALRPTLLGREAVAPRIWAT